MHFLYRTLESILAFVDFSRDVLTFDRFSYLWLLTKRVDDTCTIVKIHKRNLLPNRQSFDCICYPDMDSHGAISMPPALVACRAWLHRAKSYETNHFDGQTPPHSTTNSYPSMLIFYLMSTTVERSVGCPVPPPRLPPNPGLWTPLNYSLLFKSPGRFSARHPNTEAAPFSEKGRETCEPWTLAESNIPWVPF